MNFKAGNRQIYATCAAITETSLLLIEKKRQYDHREFTLCQADHHAAVRALHICSCYQSTSEAHAKILQKFMVPWRTWKAPECHDVCVLLGIAAQAMPRST